MSARRGLRLLVLTSLILMTSAACAPGASSPTASPAPTASTAVPSPTPTSTPVPLISLDTPAVGATVAVPVTMSGTANTFEAALVVDALDSAGNQLCVRNIMATSGSGTPGTWQTTLDFPPPAGDAPVTLRAYDFSAKDGSIENLVQQGVTLSGQHPAIFITSPACGAQVAPGSTLTVTGRALVFEAMFTLEIRDSSGAAVVTSQVMAESGSEESNFSSALSVPAGLPGGFYDLVAFDNSMKDGSVIDEFSVQLQVQ